MITRREKMRRLFILFTYLLLIAIGISAACAVAPLVHGAGPAQTEERGVAEIRAVVYPDRFPIATGPATDAVDGRARQVAAFVVLDGTWATPPNLTLYRTKARLSGVESSDKVALTGPTPITDSGSTPPVTLRTGDLGDYQVIYAELEDADGRTWKSQSVTVEWRDAKPIGDFQGILQSGPGGGDWAGVLVPVAAAIIIFMLTGQAWLAAALYVVTFIAMTIFLDVSIWIIVLNVLAGIGVAAIGAVMFARGR